MCVWINVWLYTVKCALYTVQCTLYTYTLYNVATLSASWAITSVINHLQGRTWNTTYTTNYSWYDTYMYGKLCIKYAGGELDNWCWTNCLLHWSFFPALPLSLSLSLPLSLSLSLSLTSNSIIENYRIKIPTSHWVGNVKTAETCLSP